MKEILAGIVTMAAAVVATDKIDSGTNFAETSSYRQGLESYREGQGSEPNTQLLVMDAVIPPKIQTRENSIVEISS